MNQMETIEYEVVYEVIATCAVRVNALTKKSAAQMVNTGEAGVVEDDFINYERRIINCSEVDSSDISPSS